MSYTPDYGTICEARTHINRLILELDFAMWLNIEYDGELESARVNLAGEAKAAFSGVVDTYLAEHRADLITTDVRCTRCNSTYMKEPRLTRCTSEPYTGKCDGELVEVPQEEPSEEWLRQQAGFGPCLV